ncbi:aminopeptidase P N-terminal domain-containing protein [Spirulina subsalsa FACHB-351]|uniref:Xaa-Pro aminopeptidase n=1 Tax=Spirulina subsalsa FACHB-351 TaxID=234711 RepID=A0ABT3LB84_9CYAN|nr:aminopeptidase P N-terminal domain-containing protein [Spirulina subsalsa]MCW6038774.1 aminopeptidase P N-terminal domain-containing protein [Spirulina subsalsa FACHB-351]
MSIDAAEYRHRREQIMAKIGQGTAVFRSAPMVVMHNDVEYPFRQDSDFFYLTGFNEPEAVAVLAPHHDEHRFILFVQPKDPEKETWTGYRVGIEQAKERYGADEAYPITEFNEKFPQYIQKAEQIYYHLGRDEGFNQTILQHWQRFIMTYPRRGTGPLALVDSNSLIHPLRQVKSAAELELMRRATSISAEAHNRARHFAKPGMYEYQVQAEIEHTFRLQGGMGPAYPSIVASGPNACILHYTENNRQMQDGDLLLIDAGCAFDYYNGDITRTFPVNGQFNKYQQAIYELVLAAQMKAIAEVQPGKAYNEFHDIAVCVLVQGLIDLGLLQGDLEELIKEEKYKPFYMHRTGHWLGLDVHDVGIYQPSPEQWHVLQPGNILTVEPGLYIAPDIKPAEGQPEVPPEWRGIGVRIEDDVLVTEQGHDILTADVPKAIADL